MKTVLPPEVEAARFRGDPGSGPCGAFRLLCPVLCRTLTVIADDGRHWGEATPAPTPDELALMHPKAREIWARKYAGRETLGGLPPPAWEHVSVSAATVPTWAEMCWVKGLFWGPEEWVVQYHPAVSEYVNDHERVLHLWRPIGVPVPTPPKECV